MSWYLKSLRDHDTHRGQYSITTRSVHATCGAEFVPLRQRDGGPIVLPGDPPDPEQICPSCKQGAR